MAVEAVQRTSDASPAHPRVAPDEAGEVDDVTLARARGGDREALTALVRRYQRRVFALATRLLLGRPDLSPEDLAQESFLKALRGLSTFRPEGAARLSTWLLTITTRTCLDALRRRDRSAPLPETLPASEDPEAHAGDRQLGRRVQAAIAALPVELQAVLVLRAYHDLDYPEIGAALDIPAGTVKSRLSRARAALVAALEEPR